MRRRRVLTVGAAAAASIAGCVATPSPPNDSASPPNVFASYERTDEGYRVSFEYGTTVTADNAASLTVSAMTDDGREHVTWAATESSGEGPSVAPEGGANPADEFPIEPGDSLDVPYEAPESLQIVWTAPDGRSSSVIDRYEPDEDGTDETAAMTEEGA